MNHSQDNCTLLAGMSVAPVTELYYHATYVGIHIGDNGRPLHSSVRYATLWSKQIIMSNPLSFLVIGFSLYSTIYTQPNILYSGTPHAIYCTPSLARVSQYT